MDGLESPFLFTVCQVGAEPALKKEIAREHEGLRFAFSRPGFVTFKNSKEGVSFGLDFELKSVFARAYGVSFGKCDKSLGSDSARAKKVLEFASRFGTNAVFHVWERDFHPVGEEPLGFIRGNHALHARECIEKEAHAMGVKCLPFSPARDKQIVVDVVVVEPQEWWIGAHRHGAGHSPDPGGRPAIKLPLDAPSRAFLKLEEALRWSGAPVRAGDTAVEIGSAPGGASDALLRRGLKVVGIDPAAMDPRILRTPGFTHIARPVASVPREELPRSVEWLLLDMNVTPSISLFAVDRLGSRMRGSLLGVILTVKLNQWKMADEIPGMLEHIRAMGMSKVRAAQLASNKQEVMIYGLTRKGLARMNGPENIKRKY